MHWLRKANIDIVETIKSTKHLQKNLLRYIHSQNEYAHQMYQKMRLSMALLLRELEEIKFKTDPDIKILAIDSIKLSMKESDEVMNRDIDELIRSGKVKPETGSSMINDSFYLFEIKSNLIHFFETLFAAPERKHTRAERKIALDEDEITQIRGQSPQEKTT